ncbi:Uma2 family endonuclease [Dactylosporangium aurantiacum]|uniref:Uma2 family endonuclease n=1 Tax=Dactylosporangium aurantiacum TaxID=35754 RepID=A0A9Q9IJY5_9ACTN|nr:Uma2 family endonuclease [Dactylosporangium aurantiacum]MDG6104606.1 Uma2 family endonuclease [Dactylosporangium aurantiacum]UWZ56208.1 Uma2 family endonuclease [Dactylosporangium aurantiacum]
MTVVPELPPRPLTLQDVTALAEADELHRFELTEGNLVVMPPHPRRHQIIATRLGVWLLTHGFLDRTTLSTGVRTADDDRNGRTPDIVVAKGDVPPETVWLAAAEVLLAVEVVSPGSERTDRWVKPREYADAGIAHFWRVEPDGTVLRFRLTDGVYTEVGKDPIDALIAGEVPDLS